jgi:transcription initiation factor IIE alpha subunit
MKEEVIAQNVKLQSKEVQKICGKLKDDRLIKS